ncbi:MAG: hypothetical protein QOG59_1049 [Solirubrobacteraceae bacterium]|jgi:hypothetical protein|nr:hypothetical protein [Solirubrobacteraceae bacterium]
MRKFVLLTVVGVTGLAGVAQAAKPSRPAHPAHPVAGHHGQSHPKSCAARKEGYNAVGKLVSATLSPAAGHHRYSGTLEVDVTRANHHATTGDQTFTLTDARVKFHHGVDPTAPAAGSRVGVHGTITELPKGCSSTGFSPTITVRHVDIRPAKAPKS